MERREESPAGAVFPGGTRREESGVGSVNFYLRVGVVSIVLFP